MGVQATMTEPNADTAAIAAGAATVRGLVDELGGRPLDRALLARAGSLSTEVRAAVDAYERLLAAPTGQTGPEGSRL